MPMGRPEGRAFLGKHLGDVAFGGAMDPRVGPVRFPAIEVLLRGRCSGSGWKSMDQFVSRPDRQARVGSLAAALFYLRQLIAPDAWISSCGFSRENPMSASWP